MTFLDNVLSAILFIALHIFREIRKGDERKVECQGCIKYHPDKIGEGVSYNNHELLKGKAQVQE